MSAGPWQPGQGDAHARLHSPAADRNGPPLQAALAARLAPRGRALEVASGSGQHAARFAAAFPGWQWQPTDADDAALASIAAWCRGLPNVAPPLRLDLLAGNDAGEDDALDLVFCANLLHIAPWTAAPALMALAARRLAAHGRLMVYGPFEVEGEALAPSNAAFDATLRAQDARWGLRRLGDVGREAQAVGLLLQERLALPANNLLLVFSRCAARG